MYKKLLITCLIFVLSLIIQILHSWPDQNLQIVFCDVGQGDAILLQYGFWQALIDAGPDDSVLACLRQVMPFWDRKIELVIATHMHQDHIGGFEHVSRNYQIQQMYLADTGTTDTFKKMLEQLEMSRESSFEYKPAFFNETMRFWPGGMLKILAPEYSRWDVQKYQNLIGSETTLSDEVVKVDFDGEADIVDENERSIIILLSYYDFDLLLMGDALKKNEIALIEKGLIRKVEGLKVGHHGSKTSSSEQFIHLTQPEFSVISCGANNRFNHPSQEVIDRLRQTRSQILRTDELGTIKLITNGSYYWFTN